MYIMGVVRILVNNLTRITHSRAFVVVIVASTLIVPLFVYDNASVSKNVSDNYYMGSIYPLDSIPLSHSECFLVLGNNLTEVSRLDVEFNLTISFLLNTVSNGNTSAIGYQTLTLDYSATSEGIGTVIINNTALGNMIKNLEIKRTSDNGSTNNYNVTITMYTINFYKIKNAMGPQKDTFFSFKSVSVPAQGKNFTVYYANMPSNVLGNYGCTEIFYSRNAPSTGYNVTSMNPNGVYQGLAPIKFVIFGSHIKTGEVLSITDKGQLLSLNSEGATTIYIDDKKISVDLDKRGGENSTTPDFLYAISGAAAIFVSSLFVVVGLSPSLSGETRKRYLLLPPKRSTILLSNMASTIIIASFAVSVIFVLWLLYHFLITGNFYNILSLIYTLITVDLLIFAESSIYLMASSFRIKPIRFYLDALFLGFIPVLFAALYGYLYYNVTANFISLPLNSINFIVEPLRATLSFFNEILSLIPVLSPLQLNSLLLRTPVFGIKMPGMSSFFGLDYPLVIVGSIVFPFCIIMLGILFLRRNSEEAE